MAARTAAAVRLSADWPTASAHHAAWPVHLGGGPARSAATL